MHNILELQNATKHFQTFTLREVSFALPQGYVMGFVGPNGAGKTTVIKLILNMLRRDGGSIRVFGKDNLLYEQEIKNRIGIVMDNTFYVEEWTLKDVAGALRPFYAKWDDARYFGLLSDFGLNVKLKVKGLSRGMKMKLMIAAALSHEADFLILDEPTSGLDAVARSELMEILRDFMEDESKGVLFSTHITTDLEKIADYITVINNGSILYSDTKDGLLERYLFIRGGRDSLDARQKEQIIGYREHGVGFDGLIDRAALPAMPREVATERSNLDEIIVRFHSRRENI
jgi:ABC-2 type transport system ATP-binding protein